MLSTVDVTRAVSSEITRRRGFSSSGQLHFSNHLSAGVQNFWPALDSDREIRRLSEFRLAYPARSGPLALVWKGFLGPDPGPFRIGSAWLQLRQVQIRGLAYWAQPGGGLPETDNTLTLLAEVRDGLGKPFHIHRELRCRAVDRVDSDFSRWGGAKPFEHHIVERQYRFAVIGLRENRGACASPCRRF
jgi:hypothetical protein